MTEKPTPDSVQLGCGTLIVIALIVMFFSGSRDTKHLRSRFDDLNHKIERLEKKIDALSSKLGPQPPPPPKPAEKP